MAQDFQQGTRDFSGTYRRELDGHEITLSMLLHSPKIALFENVLTEEECNELLSHMENKELDRSGVVANGGAALASARTSREKWINPAENTIADKLQNRIAKLTACSKDRMEPVNIIRYDEHQEYQPHFDYFEDLQILNDAWKSGGQRTGTFILYLTNVERGGFTRFPNLGLTLTPRAGSGLYFEYAGNGSRQDKLTLHCGTPVLSGEKWIATTWIREHSRNAV